MRGLPAESLLRTTPEQRSQEKWTVETELLAQLVEETSVVSSGHKRKKPLKVPRPDHIKNAGKRHRRPAVVDPSVGPGGGPAAPMSPSQADGSNVVDMSHAIGVLRNSTRRT
jgi:hypothetical protein